MVSIASRTLSRASIVGVAVVGALLAASVPPAGAAPLPPVAVASRVSVSATGAQALGGASGDPDISKDGRWVVFRSAATNLVPGFHPTHANIYLADRATGAVRLVSVPMKGSTEANADSAWPRVSDDGRYVVFESLADNLAPLDGSDFADVYRRDLVTGTTRLISRIPGGAGAILISRHPDISGDGSRVVFESDAFNLATPDTLNYFDVFLWTSADTLTRISEPPGGGELHGDSVYPRISRDGTTIAFESYATDVVAGGSSPLADIFVRPVGGATSRISVPTSGLLAEKGSFAPRISDDGKLVAFGSAAKDLVANDTNGKFDVFVRNRTTNVTSRVSTNAFGGQLATHSSLRGLDSTGTRIAFTTSDPDVSLPSTTGPLHLYVRDTVAATVRAIDRRDDNGGEANGDLMDADVAMSGTGRSIAFESLASNLVRNDTNSFSDLFVRDQDLSIGPFASWNAMIDQQYLDLVGRSATPGEITIWRDRLTNGEGSIARFVEGLAHSPFWAGKRAPLLRLYWAFFLREPDASGLAHWLGKYQTGTSLNAIAGSFATSSEFTTTYGSLSDTSFVQLVYGNVLQRKSDAAGVTYWVDQLQNHGLTRGAMMAKFSESPEGQHTLAPYTDVLLVRLGLLRALPTPAQFASDTAAVIGGTRPIPMLVDTLRLSGAYASRFP